MEGWYKSNEILSLLGNLNIEYIQLKRIETREFL